jgi:hypothetical protein
VGTDIAVRARDPLADLETTADGLRVTIRRSKTDQEGEGATIAIIRGRVGSSLQAS